MGCLHLLEVSYESHFTRWNFSPKLLDFASLLDDDFSDFQHWLTSWPIRISTMTFSECYLFLKVFPEPAECPRCNLSARARKGGQIT